MDDGDGARTTTRRGGRSGDGRRAAPTLVVALAGVVIAVAALAAVLASPAAGVDDVSGTSATPAQVTPAEPGDGDGNGADSRALAWWMAAEVGVLVVGCAIWCRRTNRRQRARVAAVSAAPSTAAPSTATPPAGSVRPPVRFRL